MSILVLGALNLSSTGIGIIILATALLCALVISLGILSGTPLLTEIIITKRSLNDLGNLQHPLLLRLQEEAPGTYHHSVAVASLAHSAAQSIGADESLARIGSYYHDIGKLSKPQLFIENIEPKDDPHHHMDPKDSASVIIQHVLDGIDIAHQYELPEEIVNFIPEHTGTTLVYYFYSKAKKMAKRGEIVHKRDFRYPGPKPMSRETAIVMLADTVEAAVRAHKPKTDAELQAVIEEVTSEKVDDTQLDISGLKDADIATIKIAFFAVLQRMHHKRVQYPKRSHILSDDDDE